MGIFQSTNKRLNIIEESIRKIDVNGDGIVTKNEMKLAIDGIKASEEHVTKLKQELNNTKKEYQLLQSKYVDICKKINNDDEKDFHTDSIIKEELIEEIVNDIINDPETNIHGVPDFIEKQIYKKTLKAMLVGIGKICDESSIDILGHKIEFVMRPR